MNDTGRGAPGHMLRFGPVWAHTLELVRRHGDLLWPVTAALIFLPQLLMAFLTPGQTVGQPPSLGPSLVVMLAAGSAVVLTVLGQVAMTFIAMNDGTAGLTLGQVLRQAGKLVVPALAVVLIQGIAILAGLLLFVVPGFWILARLSVSLPIVTVGPHEPLEALKQSFGITRGYALPILGCLSILTLGILIVYLGIMALGVAVGAISAIAAGTPPQGWSLGRWIFELIGSGAVAAMAVVSMCFYSSLLKALRKLPRADA